MGKGAVARLQTDDLKVLEQSLQHLPQGLWEHCQRVRDLSRSLALAYGYPAERAALAGLVHDVARALPGAQLLKQARSFHLPVDEVQEQVPFLLHGPVGAELLRRDYGIADEEILTAVACHTTGRPGMTLLDQILFLADKTEPEKVRFDPELARLRRELAATDREAAVLWLLGWIIRFVTQQGDLLHPSTVQAYNHLLRQRLAESAALTPPSHPATAQ